MNFNKSSPVVTCTGGLADPGSAKKGSGFDVYISNKSVTADADEDEDADADFAAAPKALANERSRAGWFMHSSGRSGKEKPSRI